MLFRSLSGIDDKGVLELQDELRGIQRYVFGSDDRPFQKSVETTRAFGFISNERSFVLSEFSRNVETVCGRLTQMGLLGSHVSFFIRVKGIGGYPKRIYAESSLPNPTQSSIDILKVIQKKFEQLVDTELTKRNADGRGVMGTGISIHMCTPIEATIKSLFDQPDVVDVPTYDSEVNRVTQKVSIGLQEVLRGLRDTYGSSAVQLASSLVSTQRRSKARDERSLHDVERSGGEYVYGLPLVYLGEVY